MRPVRRTQARCAFTLVEIVLAILIISGIMGMLLYFYQRAAETRELVMKETEFISVGRLFMEQITTELRSARSVEDKFIGLEGSSNSISFVCTTIPHYAKWITSSNEPAIVSPATDLKRITYGLTGGTNLLAARGLHRSEEMLWRSSVPVETNLVELPSLFSTNSSLVTNSFALTNRVQSMAGFLTDQIKQLDFRYWTGQEWVDTWSGLDLPLGIEITIGAEPRGEESPEDAVESIEPFRRIIYIPNSIHPGNKTFMDTFSEFLI